MPEPTAQALGASEPSITCFKVCQQHRAPNRRRWADPPTDWLYLLRKRGSVGNCILVIERRAYVSFFIGLIVLREDWGGKRSGEGLGKPGRRWDGRASRDMQSAGQTTFGRFCGNPFQLSVS